MTRKTLRFAAAAAALLAAACGDAPTEPAALLVAEHARAALQVSVPLPSLAGAETMDGAEFGAVLRDLGIWLDAADAGLATQPQAAAGAPDLRAEIEQGRALIAQATRLEAAGDRQAAIAALIGAESHLLSTTAFAVAERRIAAAAGAELRCLIRSDAGDAASRLTIERGRHLLAHAREALAEGDVERAIQRGHYAAELMASECPMPVRAKGGAR